MQQAQHLWILGVCVVVKVLVLSINTMNISPISWLFEVADLIIILKWLSIPGVLVHLITLTNWGHFTLIYFYIFPTSLCYWKKYPNVHITSPYISKVFRLRRPKINIIGPYVSKDFRLRGAEIHIICPYNFQIFDCGAEKSI